MSVSESSDQPALRPVMFRCTRCDRLIRYSLNRQFSASIDAQGVKWEFDGRVVPSLVRGIVGDLCESCSIERAPDDSERQNRAHLLHELQVMRRRCAIPSTVTFQRVAHYPREDITQLRGFSLTSYGFWIEPLGPARHSIFVHPKGEAPGQIVFVIEIVRLDGVYAEIHRRTDPHTRRTWIEVDGAQRSTIRQTQQLMEGLRLLSMADMSRVGLGGRPAIDLDYDTASRHWIDLVNEYDELNTKRPTSADFVDYLRSQGTDISGRSMSNRIRAWRKQGLSWPPERLPG